MEFDLQDIGERAADERAGDADQEIGEQAVIARGDFLGDIAGENADNQQTEETNPSMASKVWALSIEASRVASPNHSANVRLHGGMPHISLHGHSYDHALPDENAEDGASRQ